jgi:hypothetical protein
LSYHVTAAALQCRCAPLGGIKVRFTEQRCE